MSKPIIDTQQLCMDYYFSQIFHESVVKTFLADARAEINAKDKAFAAVDSGEFNREVIALNIELFGLAWLTENKDRVKMASEITCTKSVFAKNEHDKMLLWEGMGYYNLELFECLIRDPSIDWGILRDFPELVSYYHKEFDLFDVSQAKFCSDITKNETDDAECALRLALRLVLGPLDSQKLVVISQYLAMALVKKLKCNVNYSAMFAIQRIVIGMYINAERYLRCVQDSGSYIAWKEKSKADTLELNRVGREWIAKYEKEHPGSGSSEQK